MTNPSPNTSTSYVVIRLVPEAPIDGATFSSYLNGLTLQAVDAYTGEVISDAAYGSPLTMFPYGFVDSQQMLYASSQEVAVNTPYDSSNQDYGSTLQLLSTDGISVGSYPFTATDANSGSPAIPLGSFTVTEVTADSVTVTPDLSNYVAAGVPVTFIGPNIENLSGTVTNPSTSSSSGGNDLSFPASSPSGTAKSNVLNVTDTAGVMVGMGVAGSGIPSGTVVIGVSPSAGEVIISQAATETIDGNSNITFTLEAPFVSFTRLAVEAKAGSQPDTTVIEFKADPLFPEANPSGIPVGALVSPVDSLIAPGTTVIAATQNSLTVAPSLLGPPSQGWLFGQSLVFNFMLSSNIAQHTEPAPGITVTALFGKSFQTVLPAAVATAVLPLTETKPPYLDIQIQATRGAQTVPFTEIYHNVAVCQAQTLVTGDLFQQIPDSDTGLYLMLPPPPGVDTIELAIPSDGSAPRFDDLYAAMQTALTNDKITDSNGNTVTAGELINSSAWCTRVAYDIVWSYQNALPALPDPIESMYTTPPNAGGGGESVSSSGTSNNYEQDRQKFEGTLSSFYSTRNATAERLTKFVAAASAAAACEQYSAAATSALLEFPVDTSVGFANAVDSEILLQGINGSNGPSFAVPAAFFYALGNSLDKKTSAAQRYQSHTGDAIERLLQQFATAVDSSVIDDSETFTDATLGTATVTSYQAARRLVALGVPSASTTPSVNVESSTHSKLATLVNAWLAVTDPDTDGTQNPPASYQNEDFTIWSQQLAANDAAGYLELDLAALTQGYVIPPFTASPSTVAGSALTFPAGLGIGSGMPVTGPGISSDTTVDSVTTTTGSLDTVTVTLSPTPNPPLTTADALIFNAAAPVTATPFSASGTVLSFPAVDASGISAGMTALAPGIAAGTTVQQITTITGAASTTSVTLSSAVGTDFDPTNVVTFAFGSSTLADQIEAWLPDTTTPPNADPTVATLKQVDAGQWKTFFTANPTWLPPLTQAVAGASPAESGNKPGYLAARITAFVRAVELFFTVSTALSPSSPELPAPNAPPIFDLPVYDPIGQAATAGSITFGGGALSSTELNTLAQNIFGGDPAAQAWLGEAMTTINELWTITDNITTPTLAPYTVTYALKTYSVTLQFSLMEALYARGFRRAADVAALSQADFQQALIGTVAYDYATQLHANAPAAASATSGNGQTSARFEPINPDDTLMNCVAPPCLSATGPIAYLQEMLTLSTSSTCQDVTFAPITREVENTDDDDRVRLVGGNSGISVGMSAVGDGIPAGTTIAAVGDDGTVTLSPPTRVESRTWVVFSASTLGTTLGQRRGPIGDLAASCANLQTPLPLIDLVNECLEYLGSPPQTGTGSSAAPVSGMVYDTAPDVLAGHTLVQPGQGQDGQGSVPARDEPIGCHDPTRLLAALPEHSTPGLPDDTTPQPSVYRQLETSVSSCLLPYSQALDVSRTYLNMLGSSRFEEMRTFRRCITEFVLAPTQEPAGFASWRRRYPVGIDTAIEYLGITPAEYTKRYGGLAAPPCAPSAPPQDGGDSSPQTPDPTTAAAAASPAAAAQQPPTEQPPAQPAAPAQASPKAVAQDQTPREPVTLTAFLEGTCLSYCEFYELWESQYVQFSNGATIPAAAATGDGDSSQSGGAFPPCEPCCPEQLWLQFPAGQQDQQQDMQQLALFVRLWHTLRESCSGGYSFAQLRDICDVLQLWTVGPATSGPNPDFIRQLAALQMLRDEFGMDLTNPAAPVAQGAVDADRTHLLALWAGPSAAQWHWALKQLIARVEQHAQRRHGCGRRPAEFVKLLIDNLDPLSQLAGFDPDSAQYCWHALPAHTLRFAEVLSKVYASDLTVGELLFLFTAESHLDGDDPFPLQARNDALDFPLGLPDDEHEHSLWRLRRELLEAHDEAGDEVGEELFDGEQWSWPRIAAALQFEFGFAAADIAQLAEHFFPRLMARLGVAPTSAAAAQFVSAVDSSAPMWNEPPDGPLHYDPPSPSGTSGQLSACVPMSDRAVITKLTDVHELGAGERKAMQDLFFQPRALLARFALLFTDFSTAQRVLIEEPDEERRFGYFRRQFLGCRHRAHLIAEHLTRHVAAVTGQHGCPDAAALILRSLAADENMAQGSWEPNPQTQPSNDARRTTRADLGPARRQRTGSVVGPDRHRTDRRLPRRKRRRRVARHSSRAARFR